MSGNNYDDILEHIDRHEAEKLKKIVHLMSSFRPQATIDRAFQRKLKQELFTQKKIGSSWNLSFPQLSLLITSFFVIIGLWKLTGGNLVLVEAPKSTNTEVAQNDITPSQENASLQMEASSVGAEETASLATVDNGTALTVSDLMTMQAYKASDMPKNEAKSTDTREIDLSQEIASISSDIDTIATLSTPEDPTAGSSLAKSIPSALMATAPTEALQIPVSYPAKMAVYKKEVAWTTSEIQARSGSGILKSLEKPLSKNELESIVAAGGGGKDFSLEYKVAKKEGSTSFYLIPCLRYTDNIDAIKYIPIISGYTLD